MQQNIGPIFLALELGGGIASTYALQVYPFQAIIQSPTCHDETS